MVLMTLVTTALVVLCAFVHHEALTGLLMISWTASLTYLEMSRYLGDR